MTIKEINGNLLDSTAEVILQQVNCQGKMASGVAKAIREKWPVVYDKYNKYVSHMHVTAPITALLGIVQPVTVEENKVVLNLFAQENYGYDGRRYTSYDALDTCIKKVAKYCTEHDVKTIALPWHMASDRGGANWNVVVEMIKGHFENTEVIIEIWKLI